MCTPATSSPRIDDGDYQARGARRRATRSPPQQATIDRIGQQIAAQAGRRRSGQGAARFGARPAQTRAELELERQQALAAQASLPASQALEQAQAARDQAVAVGRRRARPASMRRQTNVDVLKAQQQEARAAR